MEDRAPPIQRVLDTLAWPCVPAKPSQLATKPSPISGDCFFRTTSYPFVQYLFVFVHAGIVLPYHCTLQNLYSDFKDSVQMSPPLTSAVILPGRSSIIAHSWAYSVLYMLLLKHVLHWVIAIHIIFSLCLNHELFGDRIESNSTPHAKRLIQPLTQHLTQQRMWWLLLKFSSMSENMKNVNCWDFHGSVGCVGDGNGAGIRKLIFYACFPHW